MSAVKRTKIIATLGPATDTPEMIARLIEAGVDAFRLNFSHGSHDSHGELIARIKAARKKVERPVAILQDLSGPKIRMGMFPKGPIELAAGDTVVLDTSLNEYDGKRLPVSYAGFAHDVAAGHHLLLADGNLELEILEVKPPRVTCRVLVGGSLSSKKGINYPGGSFSLPAITEKDKDDLRFGLEQGVDYVALSFVKTAEDVETAREIIRAASADVSLIAKIEKHEAIRNLDAIMHAVDGVMVSRGDLGVEIPLEQVPFVQKRIIHLANRHGKPVITATQMLLSMVNAPRPTRAEASDIANAIADGTDVIMLSDETAGGSYPVEAVEMMRRIAMEVEKNFAYYNLALHDEAFGEDSIPQAISFAATSLAQSLDARAILSPTSSGFTARMMSRFRPRAHVLALTPNRRAYYRMALQWGVVPHYLPIEEHMDKLLDTAVRLGEERKLLQSGDKYVITAGFPFGMGASTNLIQAGVVE